MKKGKDIQYEERGLAGSHSKRRPGDVTTADPGCPLQKKLVTVLVCTRMNSVRALLALEGGSASVSASVSVSVSVSVVSVSVSVSVCLCLCLCLCLYLSLSLSLSLSVCLSMSLSL